jgi:hypothetical protein
MGTEQPDMPQTPAIGTTRREWLLGIAGSAGAVTGACWHAGMVQSRLHAAGSSFHSRVLNAVIEPEAGAAEAGEVGLMVEQREPPLPHSAATSPHGIQAVRDPAVFRWPSVMILLCSLH